MHTVFALLCFVVVIHWLIFPYPSGLLHWHCGNLTIAPVPAKQPWWIWIHTSCEFIMNDCITTTKQSTTKPCAYFLGYTVHCWQQQHELVFYHRHLKMTLCIKSNRSKRDRHEQNLKIKPNVSRGNLICHLFSHIALYDIISFCKNILWHNGLPVISIYWALLPIKSSSH